MNQYNGSAISITVRKSKVVASLTQFVSGLGMQVNSAGMCTGIAHSFSTFGLVSFRVSTHSKHKALPFGCASAEEDIPTSWERQVLDGSIALILDSKLDESTRLGGWLETRNSNPRDFQWGVTVRDTPEGDFGWGLTIGGLVQDAKNLKHFQVETFLNLNVGSKLKLQPAVLFVKDGATQFPAMMLRSSWYL